MADRQPKDPYTLFGLTDEIKAIVADIVEADIAGDEDEVQALIEELDTLYDAKESKRQGYVHVIKNSLASAENHKGVAEDFEARAKAHTNLAKKLKNRLLFDMQENDEQAAPAGDFKIARQRNSQPSVVLSIQAEDLPAEFQKVTVDADKDALKFAINAGEVIDGVDLETGEHIRIYVR